MTDFISEIRKINTDGLIYHFSKKSIEMFLKHEFIDDVEYPVIQYGRRKKCVVQLSAWDIHNIEYFSIKHSNDYRSGKHVLPVPMLVDLYRDYENERSNAISLDTMDSDEVFRVLLGMTAEQFQFQSRTSLFNNFNRNYQILVAGENYEHRFCINSTGIIKEIFGFSLDEYISILLIVFYLCMKDPIPLRAFNEHYKDFPKPIDIEKLEHLINYYSCTYDQVRNSGPLLFYAKPFIKTEKNNCYMCSNIFLVAFTLANGLYWAIRDYYKNNNSQKFVYTFGLLFEDYIKDLASTYCKKTEYDVIPQGTSKGADFWFQLGDVRLIIEAKTGLLSISAKQQIPNTRVIDKYVEDTLKKAYTQVQSSYLAFYNDSKQTAKIILLYDEFSNTAIIEQSIEEIFLKDLNCFIMTIREFEILLYLHHHNPDSRDCVLKQLFEKAQDVSGRQNIGKILKQHNLLENKHFCGEKDYYTYFTKKLLRKE